MCGGPESTASALTGRTEKEINATHRHSAAPSRTPCPTTIHHHAMNNKRGGGDRLTSFLFSRYTMLDVSEDSKNRRKEDSRKCSTNVRDDHFETTCSVSTHVYTPSSSNAPQRQRSLDHAVRPKSSSTAGTRTNPISY